VLLAAAPAFSQPRFEITGRAEVVGDRLLVTLEMSNVGSEPASDVEIAAELAEQHVTLKLPGPIEPSQGAEVVLDFRADVPRPGSHAASIGLSFHAGRPPIPEAAPTSSQRAFLIFALGATPAPAVSLEVPRIEIVHSEMLPILVRNLEGTRHRAWVRVTTPIGINALPARSEVDLEPGGSAIVETRILRGSAQREASHGIIVLAGIVDGPLERTVGTLGTVWIEPDRALMPRLRRPALIVALFLLLAAVVLEFRRRRR